MALGRYPSFGAGQVGYPPVSAAGRFGNSTSAPYGRSTSLPARYPSGAAVYPSLSTNLFGTRFGTVAAVSYLQRRATLVLRGGE
jgi:hypothetical protein